MTIYTYGFSTEEQSANFVAHMAKEAVAGANNKLACHSEDVDTLIYTAPIVDDITKKPFAEASVTLKVEKDGFGLVDVEFILNNRPQTVQFYGRLSGSEEYREFYEATIGDATFVANTINRYAAWDKNLEGTTRKVNLCAFPFAIGVYNDVKEIGDEMGIFPLETPAGIATHLSEQFVVPIEEEEKEPCTYFLGRTYKIQDVEIVLRKRLLAKDKVFKASILYVKCFAGILPMFVSREVFDLDKFTKDKILAISAQVRVDLGAEPDSGILNKSNT